MAALKKRERLLAAIRGEAVDRPPAALWRHLPVDDRDPEQLAQSVADFQKAYDWDFVKVTPWSTYQTDGWGSATAYHGDSEGSGTRPSYPLHSAEDWQRLAPLAPDSGPLGEQLRCLRLARKLLGPDVPIIQTIFSPLAQARHLIAHDLEVVHLRQQPALLHAALEVMTATTVRYIEAVLEAGADGIFYAIRHANAAILSRSEYQTMCRPLDLRILNAAQQGSFNLLHMHGAHPYLDLVSDYPIQALNWHDRETTPALAEGLAQFPGLVVGGLSQQELIEGTPESVGTLARQARTIAQDRRLCLSTGCVMLTTTPWGNIRALRAAAE